MIESSGGLDCSKGASLSSRGVVASSGNRNAEWVRLELPGLKTGVLGVSLLMPHISETGTGEASEVAGESGHAGVVIFPPQTDSAGEVSCAQCAIDEGSGGARSDFCWWESYR